MTEILRQVLLSLSQSASAIEGAFLKAGDGLSQGLALFERLNATMASLSGELNGGTFEDAALSLDRLSDELLAIGSQIPDDLASLVDLVARNDAIAARFERLLEHIRTMTIISRSARIEAVVFADKALGLQNFTDEIMKLTREVQTEITTCARDHAKICHLLRQVSKDQTHLDRDHREKLIALAHDLKATFSTLRARRAESAGFIEDLTQRSARITAAARLGFVALQSGDSTRQRLEHIHDVMGRVIDLSDGHAGEDPTVPPEARDATLMVLCRLQDAQIVDAIGTFDKDAGEIDKAIRLLIDDTQELIEHSHGVFGAAGDGLESFVNVFRARLIHATDLIRTCEATRRSVAGVTTTLQSMLADLHQTMSGLHQTTESIVLVGVNAGLKAARLGPEGRSLIVIADELKRLASNISTDGAEMLPAFDAVQQASRHLVRQADRPADTPNATVDQEMLAIIEALDQGGARLNEVLKGLQTESGRFDADLKRVTQDFAAAVAMNADLLDAARRIGAAGQAADHVDTDPADGMDYADAIIGTRYTMAREREIHAEIIVRQAA